MSQAKWILKAIKARKQRIFAIDKSASAMIYSTLKRFTKALGQANGQKLLRSPQIVRDAIVAIAVGAFFACSCRSVTAQSNTELAQHQTTAQQAEARGDFETAIREYRALASAMPGNAELESNLGVALYFHHDLALAETELRKALHLNSALYPAHLFLGLIKSRESQPDAAVVELEKAVKLNDADPMAHAWLGYAYIAQARYPQAVEQLNLAFAEQPRDIDVAYALGQCYLELGKQATTSLLKAAPDGGRTWQLAAEQAELQGNTKKARDFYLEALQRRPDIESLRAKVMVFNGSLPAQKGQPAPVNSQEDALYEQIRKDELEAKSAFEKVSTIEPDSYRVHEILANADVAADRLDDAVVEYKNVLQRKPDLPGIHGALCNALSRTAQLAEAITECEAEVDLSPHSAEACVQAARVHLLRQDYDRADVLLQKARNLDRPPIALYKYLGEVAINQQKYQEAVTSLKRYIAVESKDSSAFYLLSRAYKSLGETQQMKEAIARYKSAAARANPNEAQLTLDATREDPSTMQHD